VQRSFNGPTVNVFFSPIESLVLNKGPSISSPPLAKNLKLSKNVRAGELATLTGTLWDANADDVLSLSIDWGDGSKPSAIVPNRDRFSVSHKYVKDGTYTVRAIWTDNTGQSNFRELILRVKRAAAKARK
jgi:PKD domain